ncbi:MAG: ribonuclease III [Crocinitomicaceae bacterium]|nr:ribonuclease III [Crocinitomicaceae bacterium]
MNFLKRFFTGSAAKNKSELKIIRFIIKQFGYRPKKLYLFTQALRHKSVLENKEQILSNERLEFLGDAILDSIVAEFLYEKFKEEDEGYLTKIKSIIVSRKTLESIAHKMQLRDILEYKESRSLRLSTLEGNAFEALVGALFLDGGYDVTKKAIIRHVFRLHLDIAEVLENDIDFKSKLFIWAQKNKIQIDFKIISETHMSNGWIYETEVLLNKQPYGRGIGSSKKESEQNASKETLSLMGEI